MFGAPAFRYLGPCGVFRNGRHSRRARDGKRLGPSQA